MEDNSEVDFWTEFKKYNRSESQDTTLRTAKEFKNYQHPHIPNLPPPRPSVPPIQNSVRKYIINDQNSTGAESTIFGGCDLSPIKKVSN